MPPLGHRKSMVDRFWAKVDKSGECWVWTAAVSSKGYGYIGYPGLSRAMYAHRFSAMLHFGMFDMRLHVLHRCDNPPCIRPEHLFLGTHAENMEDMKEKGRGVGPNASKTHCINGHEYTVANTYYQPRWGEPGKTGRVCITCRNARKRVCRVSC